jgi:hypothetical protein
MKAVVFLGPTLTVQDAAALLDADYLPAARQGDVYRVVRDRRPAAIGLVDGVFKQAPAGIGVVTGKVGFVLQRRYHGMQRCVGLIR